MHLKDYLNVDWRLIRDWLFLVANSLLPCGSDSWSYFDFQSVRNTVIASSGFLLHALLYSLCQQYDVRLHIDMVRIILFGEPLWLNWKAFCIFPAVPFDNQSFKWLIEIYLSRLSCFLINWQALLNPPSNPIIENHQQNQIYLMHCYYYLSNS